MEKKAMDKKRNINIAIIVGSLVCAIGLGFLFDNTSHADDLEAAYKAIDTSSALFPQEVISVNATPRQVVKIYRDKQLIGIINNNKQLDKMFNEVYKEQYADEFPGSKLGFVDDIVQVPEMSFNNYDNKDQEIFNYVKEENLFAVEANKVTFSNGAIIYVKNSDDFDAARDKFIMNFTNDETFDAMKNNKPIPHLTDYGTRDIDISVKETVKVTRDLATKNDILKDEDEILTFLAYGYEPKIDMYTIQPYDTLEGIAVLNGMNVNQIQSINKEKIVDTQQVLEEGTQLQVSRFNSPLTVSVTKERKEAQLVYPEEAVYEGDDTLDEGTEVVDIVEENGSRDVTYEDVYINGESVSTTEISSKEVKKPVRGKIRYGTKVEVKEAPVSSGRGKLGPSVGSGNWRWPLDNAYVLCRHGCYPNHNGTDFSTNGSGYGPIYAIDRGVVVGNSYDAYGWGNYIVIDHGNGYRSLYAHMEAPGYAAVGQTVGKGENIGYVGMTGRTTYQHVHLEITIGGVRVDACSVIGC